MKVTLGDTTYTFQWKHLYNGEESFVHFVGGNNILKYGHTDDYYGVTVCFLRKAGEREDINYGFSLCRTADAAVMGDEKIDIVTFDSKTSVVLKNFKLIGYSFDKRRGRKQSLDHLLGRTHFTKEQRAGVWAVFNATWPPNATDTMSKLSSELKALQAQNNALKNQIAEITETAARMASA